MDLKKLLKTSLQTLVPCLFFGWTLIAVAGGSIYPPINYIAKPFVCPNGDLKFVQQGYRPSPGTTVTTTTWLCTNPGSETPKEINVMALTIPAGLIDGLIAFFPILVLVLIVQYRQGKDPKFIKAAAARQEDLERMERIKQRDLAYRSGSRPSGDQQASFDSQEILASAENVRQMGGKVVEAGAELGKLKQLLNQGLITQQDFDQKKAEILKRI